jgi:minor histocompatibility antigen H13
MEILLRSLEGESPALQFIGKWGYVIYEKRETVKMYIHMIISALFPIYIGSHASLRRPPSAEPPTKRKGHSKEEEYDDEFEAETKLEGLSPSDAILFPVIAGITLSTLYFIIKWFKAGILNLVLRWYFSGLGVFGVGKLAAESLNVVTTFIFPTVWASQGQAYHIDPLLSRQEVEQINKVRTLTIRKFAEEKVNPFPGILSSIQFPESINLKLWSLRALLKNHWLFRGYLHGIFSFKTKVRMNDMIGLIFGIATIVLYNLVGESWWLTNLIGFGFCYGTLQLMSPTTFSTGSLLLAGLFIYDIVMVFYTCVPFSYFLTP